MALPVSRDITISTGTQVPSTLLNNVQDMIIGNKHGSITKRLAAIGNTALGSSWEEHVDGRFLNATSSGNCHIHIPLPTGAVLTAVKLFLRELGASPMSALLRSNDWTDDTIVSPVGSTFTGAGSGGFIQPSLSFPEQTQTEAVNLLVRVIAGQSTDDFYGITYTYRNP